MAGGFTFRHGITFFRANSNLVSGDSSETSTYSYLDSVERGASVPNWRNRIKAGEGATTYLSGVKTTVTKSPGSGRLQAHTVPTFPIPLKIDTFASGDLCPIDPSFSDGAPDEDIRSAVQSDFLSKCFQAQRTVQSLTIGGEFAQTLAMLRRPAGALFAGVNDYLNTLRRRRGRIKPKHKKRFLADTWLEYSFGWLPLMSDLKDGAKALALTLNETRDQVPVFLERVGTGDKDLGPQAGNQDQLSWTGRLRERVTYQYKLFGMVATHVTDPPTYLAQQWGFDARSFIPSVWNLIPYSFVVDYFTNVGSFLEACMFCNSDLRWCYSGEKIKTERFLAGFKVEPHLLNPSIWEVDQHYVHPPSVQVLREKVTRQPVGPDELVPLLRFKIPGHALWKAANLAALYDQFKKITPY